MTSSPDDINPETLRVLRQACVRVVRARIHDPHDCDDLVQEAIVRTLTARSRLTDPALVPYGVTVARNLCLQHLAAVQRERRNRHRLFERPTVTDPLSDLQRRDERAAVVLALRELRTEDRQLLVDHVLGGQPLSTPTPTPTSTGASVAGSGARGARLARSRAKARVDYVLALRRQQLPSADCRPVLVAISAADKRRQDALDAPGHLAVCPVCPTVVEPLAQRRAALAGLLPIPLGLGLAKLTAAANRSPAHAAAAASVAVVIAGTVAVASVNPAAPGRPMNAAGAGRRAATVRPAPSAGAATQPGHPFPAPAGSGTLPGLTPLSDTGRDPGSAPALAGGPGSPGATPASATPASATPAGSIPAGATPANATPASDSSPPVETAAASPVLWTCHFAVNSSELTPADLRTIADAAGQLTSLRLTRVTVVGMTDPSGDATKNVALAHARAAAVAARLGSLAKIVVRTQAAPGRPNGRTPASQRQAVIQAS